MSPASVAQLGSAVAEVMGARPYALLALDEAVATQRTDADVAFISREVTGTSTKHEIHPALQQVYTLLRQSPGLQWVHIHSAGADRQIYQDLMAKGVRISTSSGANAQVVATVALAGLLAMARKFPLLWAEQQARQWIPMMGHRPKAGEFADGAGAQGGGGAPKR
jgi:phosphoglycerate dehydrogenase-like enzyme